MCLLMSSVYLKIKNLLICPESNNKKKSLSSVSQALSRLHQLELLGHTLVVQFAKGQDNVTALKDPPVLPR